MPSEAAEIALRDILDHIDLASEFAFELDKQAFRNDLKTVYAVTRCLEIISEASRRLPTEIKGGYPEIGWREIAAAGNIYRHEYEYVSADLVFKTLRSDLPLLRIVIETELQRR